MSRRAVVNTAFASYLQMGSIALTGMLSVSLALRYLDTDRMGLWSFVTQSLGYLLLLDFGITNSAGRLLGEPLHSNDAKECGRWLSLLLVVTGIQGLLVFVTGVFSADAIIAWFHIAEPLRPEAHTLWIWMLTLNAVTFPLRVVAGILYAQNRNYWALLAGAAGNWFGLAVFFYFLKNGSNTIAYAYSAAVTAFFSFVLPWLAIKWGPHRFELSFRNLRWNDFRELLNFSSGMFVISIAIQVIFLSQTLVITKMLGLTAVAVFMVSCRAGTYGLQVLWRTYDALSPRWQQLYVAGDHEALAGSFKRYTGLTMSLAFLGGTLVLCLNHPFVNLLNAWAKRPGMYAGLGFDALLALYIVQHTWNHCLSFVPLMSKQIRWLSIVAVIDMLLNISLSVALAPAMGVKGVLAGSLIGSLASMIYLTWFGLRFLSMSATELVMPLLGPWLALSACAMFTWLAIRGDPEGNNLWLRGSLCLIAGVIFAAFHRADLADFWRRSAKKFNFSRAT